MKSNSKSNSIFASIGRGIKQAARWVAKMFSYKVENKFARGVWYVFATGAAIFAVYLTVALTIEIIDGAGYAINNYKYHRKYKNGNIITPPSYFCINAIGLDRYHCDGPNGSVILDSKGNECGEKL